MTSRLELNWKLDSFVDEQRYYCSETPIDVESLPSPKAILLADARTYTDTDIDAGKTYYVRIGSVKNGVEKVGDEKFVATSAIKYRYIMIYMEEINGGDKLALQEVEISSVNGGADITWPSMITNQSSSFISSSAQRLVDNNFINFEYNIWEASNSSVPQWVTFDFGSEVDVSEVRVWPQNWAPGPTRSPKILTIRGAKNDGIWGDIKTYSDVTGWIQGKATIFNLLNGTFSYQT